MASSQTMADFAHQNLRSYLFLTVGEVKEMIGTRSDKVLKFEYPRQLNEETTELLKVVLVKLEEFYRMASEKNGEKVFTVGIKEICDCPIHLRYMKAVGVVTLADFLLPPDPVQLLAALVAAETETVKAGGARQPHLFTRIFPKIEFSVRKMLNKKAADGENNKKENGARKESPARKPPI